MKGVMNSKNCFECFGMTDSVLTWDLCEVEPQLRLNFNHVSLCGFDSHSHWAALFGSNIDMP
jgi:hypothetical protein